MHERFPDPGDRPYIEETFVVRTQDGDDNITLNNRDTVVRTFGPQWEHMNYIYIRTADPKNPARIFNSPDLVAHLIDRGFMHMAVEQPAPIDREYYAQHFAFVLKYVLPTTEADK